MIFSIGSSGRWQTWIRVLKVDVRVSERLVLQLTERFAGVDLK
jgi:hypothetical protein